MKDANSPDLEGHVLVRVASVPDFAAIRGPSEVFLNEKDRQRAGQFRRPEDRARFVAGREILGRCLQECRGYPAEPLKLICTEHGRPLLVEDPEVQFSISHSGEMIALAITIKSCVGVDLEAVSRRVSLSEIAERIFSSADFAIFKELPPEESSKAFFRAWTGKEAYLKATGLGLSGGLQEISIPWEDGDFSIQTFRPEGAAGPAWCMQGLPLPAGYMGHVVWDDPRKCLDFRVVNPTSEG